MSCTLYKTHNDPVDVNESVTSPMSTNRPGRSVLCCQQNCGNCQNQKGNPLISLENVNSVDASSEQLRKNERSIYGDELDSKTCSNAAQSFKPLSLRERVLSNACFGTAGYLKSSPIPEEGTPNKPVMNLCPFQQTTRAVLGSSTQIERSSITRTSLYVRRRACVKSADCVASADVFAEETEKSVISTDARLRVSVREEETASIELRTAGQQSSANSSFFLYANACSHHHRTNCTSKHRLRSSRCTDQNYKMAWENFKRTLTSTTEEIKTGLRRRFLKKSNLMTSSSFQFSMSFINLAMFFLFLAVHVRPSIGLPIRWDISPFTDCDVTCGRGIQTRSVICRSMPEGGNLSASALEHPHHHHQPRQGRTMDELMCPKPKPQETRVCSQSKCPPVWKLGAWSKCSRTCGRGIQRRDIACMQKLGTGETTTVPYQHCSRMKPHRLRYCNQVDCPPRYMIKQWSPCRGRCGQSVQVRTVACIGLLAGKTKPQLISTLRCSKLRRPKTRKRCQLPQCSSRGDVTQTRGHLPAESNSGGRVANRRLERFVQLMPKAKVRLDVGTRAFVLTKTTIVVKCRMDDIRKQPTKWRRNRRPIRSRRGSRFSVLPDGSLRILYARPTDSGRYTCLTSPSARHFFLKVLDNTTNIQQTLNHDLSSPDFDTPTDLRPGRRHFDEPLRNEQEDLDTDDLFPRLEPDLRKNSGPPSSRFHPVILIPPRSHPPQFTYPSISYAQFHPDLIERRKEVKVRDDNSKLRPVEELRPATNEPSKLLLGRPANVIHTVLQFLAESGVKDSSVEIQQLLDQLTEVSTQSEDDNVGDEERLDITTSVIEKLNLLLDRTRNQTSFRGSTRSVNTIERIIRLLEERVVPSTSPPSISSHPTLAPLQLDRDVVAYVGGNLIVTAGAEKVTILCEVTGQPTPEIKWYREGNRITNNKRQFVLGDGSLRLVYPQFSDAGNYVCIASNDHGNDSLATALDVAQIPRILSTTSSLEDFKSEEVEVVIGSYIRAKLGSKIKLMCPTEGYPDPYVEWKKDGAGLRQNVKYLPDNSLEIFPTTAADQGLYGCEATNPAGSDYQASSLVLIDPPHISEELNVIPDIDGVIGLPELLMTGAVEEEYKVKTNSSVIMGCPVAGFPEPKITWFFNNRPLTEFGRRLDYQLMRQDKVLQIPNASEDTEGVYSCHAQNEGGNLTTILVLELIVYTFQFGELTPCTASCGDVGVQYRKLRCMEDQQKKVDEWYCTGLFRPIATMQACNRVDCPPSLVVGPWGQCSVSCGNGTRTRPTSCVILSATGSTREVDRELCVQNLSMTSLTEPCFEGKCPEWIPGPWRPCSRKCLGRGVGGKTRRIHCVAGNGTKIHKKYCIHLPRPIRKSLCPNPRCEPMWTTSAWSGCSQPCGKDGIKTRILNCVYRGRPKQPAGNQCTIRRAPRIKTPCNRKICPSGNCTIKCSACSFAFIHLICMHTFLVV
ncbi:unnamed protein product [Clavelina lepadiformis]|uniref:Ig-like domain-containing protein n=1 Tax=Clavelina lepadiformis TaxID=159417 RepID=A0ABP0GRP3_CLALP